MGTEIIEKLLAGTGGKFSRELESHWSKHSIAQRDFCDFEAALVRLGKDYCRKKRHDACPFRDICEGNILVGRCGEL